MRRLLIQLANVLLLIVVLIGIPAITSLRFGSIRLSSDPKRQTLTLAGLGLAAVANLLVAAFAMKDRKGRKACWAWALLFAMVLAAEYGYIRGYIDFQWLKDALRWLQQTL
jgi:hypothetical protein